MTEHDSTRDAAQACRARGWRVLQLHSVGPDGLTCSCNQGRKCESKGKHPLDREWQNTPALSGPDVEALWEKRPRANLGIATGEASGFWVLDIDPDKGGTESAKALAAEHSPLGGLTYTVRTGSGGWHFYFAMPDFHVSNSARRLPDGIDVRGTGGQVVAPPSVTDKGAYAVISDRPIVAAPSWLLDLVRPVEPAAPAVSATDTSEYDALDAAEAKRLTSYAGRIVTAELARLDELKVGMGEGYSGPPWNHTTYEVSCTLLEIANSRWNLYSAQNAYADVFARAPRDGGFDDQVVNKTFTSAHAKIGDKARAAPVSRPKAEDIFDFMNGPEVRVDPTVVGGAKPAPAGADGLPHQSAFFSGKDGLDVAALASAVVGQGALAWGDDESFWAYRDGVWHPDPAVVEKRSVALLRSLYRNGHAANAETYVKHNVRHLDCKPVGDLINFRNVMVDWKSGEVVAHSPDHSSTVQLSVDWDAEATCPRFDAFLADIFTADYVDLAWEMIGYLMMSGNPLQIAFMLHGTGRNGKGTLLRVVQELLGTKNVSSESLDSLNTNRFAAVSLFGKIANIAGDIDGTYQESTAAFKKLTGEDYYYAERKYGGRFGFTSWAVPVFSANKIPGSADVSEGYLRRWVILHFPRTFDSPTPGLSDTLLGELPGIAAKGVLALRALMERNSFDVKGDAAKGKEDFAEAIDQVRQWVGDATLPSIDHFEPRSELYGAYRAWAERNGAGKLKATEFYHRLEAIGYAPAKSSGIRGFAGIIAMVGEVVQRSVGESEGADTFFEGVG